VHPYSSRAQWADNQHELNFRWDVHSGRPGPSSRRAIGPFPMAC
jgi:hypothetical protein